MASADRRGRPQGGKRAQKPIDKLETHPDEFVSVGHLADYWGIHVRTLQRLINKGQIRTYRFGREFRIKRDDALAFERRNLLFDRNIVIHVLSRHDPS